LLNKQQILLKNKHLTISLIQWNRELEIKTDATAREEALLQKIEEKGEIITPSWK
jgi:hypothetical protein